MKNKIVPTSHWTLAQIKPYLPEIVKSFQKVIDRFPEDITMENLLRNVLSGKDLLWLILDEHNRFVAFLTTTLEISTTGKKRILLLNVGGEGGGGLTELLPAIEDYARSLGADEICPYGRLGWKRSLEKYGYSIRHIKYGKDLKEKEDGSQ